MIAVVCLPSCPGSPSATGDRAGAGVLGKDLRDGEMQERDECLRPAGRRVAGRTSGEENVSSGKWGSKDCINLLWMRVSPKISKQIIYSPITKYFWGSGLVQYGPGTSEEKSHE